MSKFGYDKKLKSKNEVGVAEEIDSGNKISGGNEPRQKLYRFWQ